MAEENKQVDMEKDEFEQFFEDEKKEKQDVKDVKASVVPDIAPVAVAEEVPEEKPAKKRKAKAAKEDVAEVKPADKEEGTAIYALRTTANREDQVMDFLMSHIDRKKLNVYSVIRPHGMRGYIFLEAATRLDAEHAVHGIPYARGILPKTVGYNELEHMVEPVKKELNIKKNDIVEIISGPFKRETAKITRIDEQKEEVVVELVEAAVPIPITLKLDAVKVIRRESGDE